VHVICGDANLSEFATALKVGTTCLVLSLLEAGWEPLFRLRDPVAAIKIVSRDPSFRWVLELEDGRTMRATDLQRIYLADAKELLAGADPETDWVLREWERVLNDLDADVYRAEDRLDWVAKRRLLETYIEAEGLWWENEALRSLDLEYHNLDPALGLFHALEQGGQMARIVGDAEIQAAMEQPPADTRAALRGELVRRFHSEIDRLSWGRVALRTGGDHPNPERERGPARLDLPADVGPADPISPQNWGAGGAPTLDSLLSAVRAGKTVQEVIDALSPKAGSGGDDDPLQG
jgi:proteasome accessory factor A